MEILNTFMNNFIDMFISMSFYIMLGLFFVGLLNVYINKDKILKHLGKDKFSSVVKASVIGVPLPLCSCGVVPTAVELKKSGASNGAVTSFLISTPQTGVDSMLATYSMMGIVMAIYRPFAAFASGIIGGGLVNLFAKNDKMNLDNVETHSCCSSTPVEETHSCCSSTPVEESSCCCSLTPVEETHSCCSSAPVEEVSSCGCGTVPSRLSEKKFIQVFQYAYGKFLDEIAIHFLIGMFIATIISTFLPVDLFVNLGLDKGILPMFAVVLIGIPMYICSTSSIPIALSLVVKGLSYGSAFAFLFAGPVTNIASLLVLNKTLGKKITSMYIGSVVLCAVIFGGLLDYLIAQFDLEIQGIIMHHGSHVSPFSTLVALVFAVLLVRSIYKQKVTK